MKKNGAELSGIKEIARRANVSIATVDRVIHKRSGVSAATRDKITRIIGELDYQPNLLARRLASRKIIHLASLIPKVSEETSFWEAPLKGIHQAESEIRQYGIRIEKHFFDQNDKKSFAKQSQALLKSRPDGILVAPSFVEEGLKFVESCRELNIPYVFINSDLPDQKSLCFIGPHVYKSGYLAGSLISYLVKETDRVLIVNIATEFEFLFKKEEGFMDYFKEHKKPNKISRLNIHQIDPVSIEKTLSEELGKLSDVRVIYVINSRVSMVAHYLKETGKDILLIGYDFLKENVDYLQQGYIDFLICQKPFDQAYRGIMALYQNLVLASPVEPIQFMPIDIITKENYSFYRN
ncbi:MAG: substrate-binding domain-containing protein [Flavitalea sp.]